MARKNAKSEGAVAELEVADGEPGEKHEVEVSHEERDYAKALKQIKETGKIEIPAPNMQDIHVNVEGDGPLVIHRFSEKQKKIIQKKQESPSTQGRKGGSKEGRNYQQEYEQCFYRFEDGGYGIPTTAFRAAMIRACSTTDFAMTVAKLAIKVLPDGFDTQENTPLVRITKGKPRMHEGMVRLQGRSADVRIRPMWAPGWQAVVRVRFDADMFEAKDVVNLLHRAGLQVGIMEGRPSSPRSCGMDWGTFQVKQGFTSK